MIARLASRLALLWLLGACATPAPPLASQGDTAQLVASLRGQIKDHPLRQAYEAAVAGLSERARALRAQGKATRDIALELYQARRDLGVYYKSATPEPLRAYIYEINRQRYGDPLGPSFGYLERKNTGADGAVNYQAIVDSACRPNPDVDKLLSGFEQWLRQKGERAPSSRSGGARWPGRRLGSAHETLYTVSSIRKAPPSKIAA